MGDNKISEATALAASLRQIADAQYTRRQRFNGRLPADVQEVLRMAADHLQGEAVPVGGSVGALREALRRHDDGRTTIQSLAGSVADFLRTHPQPAELSEVSGGSGELPPLPAMQGFVSLYGMVHAYSAEQMQDYARAALAATGRQQVGEVK